MPEAPWTCHGLLATDFEPLDNGRYRAVVPLDGAVIHECVPAEGIVQAFPSPPSNLDVVRRLDIDGDEAWQRLTAEPEIRGVETIRHLGSRRWEWSVTVWAMEFVREEPFESELRQTIERAIRGVPAVDDVAAEDREVWIVAGSPTGDALTAAVSHTVDQLADRIRAHIESLR